VPGGVKEKVPFYGNGGDPSRLRGGPTEGVGECAPVASDDTAALGAIVAPDGSGGDVGAPVEGGQCGAPRGRVGKGGRMEAAAPRSSFGAVDGVFDKGRGVQVQAAAVGDGWSDGGFDPPGSASLLGLGAGGGVQTTRGAAAQGVSGRRRSGAGPRRVRTVRQRRRPQHVQPGQREFSRRSSPVMLDSPGGFSREEETGRPPSSVSEASRPRGGRRAHDERRCQSRKHNERHATLARALVTV